MGTSFTRTLSTKARRIDFVWRYGFNAAPALAYRMGAKSTVGVEGERVLQELNENGMAISTADALLGDSSLYPSLESAVARMEEDQAETLQRCGASADDVTAGPAKTFLHELLGPKPSFVADSIFLQFAMQEPILGVVNSYFGMFARLRHYNVWHTFKTSAPARSSQLWHRDREDRQIIKVFAYLSDVDEGAGPFTYAPGTHLKGGVRKTPESFTEHGVSRTTDEQMGKVVPPERWVRAMGRKGTIIFADTHGFHKGGLARLSDRLMYTAMFTSPASESPELMARPEVIAFPDLARTVALAGPRRFWLRLPRKSSRN